MDIVIAGGGKVGEVLCKELSVDHDVILIEQNSKRLDRLINTNDITGMTGNGASYETQVEAGVRECDIFISVTPADEVNIMAATIAKRLGASYTIARVRNPEYAGHSEFMREGLGITMMINPELEAAETIASVLRYAEALSVEQFANGRVNIVEIVAETKWLTDISLRDFRDHFGEVLICAILREEKVIIPSGDLIIQKGDHLFVTGRQEDLTKLYQKSGLKQDRLRSALIIGGGRTTHYLLEMLPELHIQMKVIEADEKVATELSEKFPKVIVIEGDGSDQVLLKEERVDRYDSVVSLTGVDEENILISLFALKQKVHKVITKVNRTDLLSLLDIQGLQAVITPKHLIANKILRFVRSLSSEDGSQMEALFRIANNQVEAIQFKVPLLSKVLNQTLEDMRVKKNVLIAYIIREKSLIFPSGQDELKPGDRVIVVTTHKDLNSINDILA